MSESAGIIRAALFDIIDRGTLCDNETCPLYHPWQFEFRFPERDEEAINRTNFVDAVITRIAELQSSPHGAALKS